MALSLMASPGRHDLEDPDEVRRLVEGNSWEGSYNETITGVLSQPMTVLEHLDAGSSPASTSSGAEPRAVEAMLVCIARFGLSKTTLDDVARQAECSRATLYRYFDGKTALVRRTVAVELERMTGSTVVGGARRVDAR